MITLIVGPQGAGKGTVASALAQNGKIVHVSTGDLLRAEAKSGSVLGKKLSQIMEAGKLVDDNLMVELLEKKLNEIGNKNVLLDGFPRNKVQAEMLNKKVKVDLVLQLDASDELCIKRISGRVQCKNCGTIYGLDIPPKTEGVCDKCGGELYRRKDDEPEAIKKRLETYHKETKPILELYKNKVKRIDASKPLNQILADAHKIVSGA